MKKTLIVVLAALSIFLFSGAAFALNRDNTNFPKTHYGFAVSAEGCAGCHVIHTATVAKLLKTGDTQTDFCYSCHSSTLTSPYDVEKGIVLGEDDLKHKSAAGFFGFTGGMKFGNGEAFEGGVETSRHQVQTPAANVTYVATGVPGNLASDASWNFSSGFKCASCHDPHAGDAANDRLLRTKIVGWATQTDITQAVDMVSDTTLVTTDYAASANAATGINEFCGLCHGKFNAPDDGAKALQNGKYRHAMGVPVATGSTTLPVGHAGASAAGNNLVLCVTCHYPHGSDRAAVSAGYNTWNIDDADTPNTFSGSVLLRKDKRDVCYDCHGAASKNTEAFGEALQ